MKRIILSLAILFVAAGAFAQAGKNSKKWSFGVTIGAPLQNLTGRDLLDDRLENKMVSRFNGGVNAQLELADDFYIQPGLLFATKGTRFKGSDAVLNLSYLEVPVHLLYKPVLGNGRLILGVGPYVAFGVGGNLKQENGSEADVVFANEVDLLQFISGNHYRGLDAGGNLVFGYELKSRFSVQLNAQLGMANLAPAIRGAGDIDARYNNSGFGFSVGYRF